MKNVLIFIVLAVMISSCIEDFDLKFPAAEPRLVVDGLITNKPGPYYIRLTKSKVGNITYPDNEYDEDNAESVMDATIIITDDSNQIDTLKLVDFNIEEYKYDYRFGYFKLLLNEYGELIDTLLLKDPSQFSHRGFYKTSRLIGVPEHTYFMKIIYKDKEYAASAYMPQVPEIDSIGYLLKKSEIIGKSDKYFPLLHFREPQGIKNYYLIQLQNDIFAQSGYGNSTWQFSILSDTFLEPYVNGLNVSTGFSPSGENYYPIYGVGDSIYVALSSLSKEGYDFYKNLIDQFGSDGGAYKPTPASPPGNISNGGLGLFRASAVSEGRTYIKRSSN